MDGNISTHRFYYSAKQDMVIEELRFFDEEDDGKSTFVRLDNGKLEKYTEWRSTPDSKSNWDDAVIVYETNAPSHEVYKRIVRA